MKKENYYYVIIRLNYFIKFKLFYNFKSLAEVGQPTNSPFKKMKINNTYQF